MLVLVLSYTLIQVKLSMKTKCVLFVAVNHNAGVSAGIPYIEEKKHMLLQSLLSKSLKVFHPCSLEELYSHRLIHLQHTMPLFRTPNFCNKPVA